MLTITQVIVLKNLSSEPTAFPDICAKAGITNRAVQKALRDFRRRGLACQMGNRWVRTRTGTIEVSRSVYKDPPHPRRTERR